MQRRSKDMEPYLQASLSSLVGGVHVIAGLDRYSSSQATQDSQVLPIMAGMAIISPHSPQRSSNYGPAIDKSE